MLHGDLSAGIILTLHFPSFSVTMTHNRYSFAEFVMFADTFGFGNEAENSV